MMKEKKFKRKITTTISREFNLVHPQKFEVQNFPYSNMTNGMMLESADGQKFFIETDNLYDAYNKGMYTYDDILDMLREQTNIQISKTDKTDPQNYKQFPVPTTWDTAKKIIIAELASAEKIQNSLDKLPHVNINDKIVVFYRFLGDNEIYSDDPRTVLTNDIMRKYQISIEDLHKQAMENTRKFRPAALTALQDNIVTISTTDSFHGAIAVFYPNVLESCAGRLEGDFFLMFQCVHTAIAQLDDGNFDQIEASYNSMRDYQDKFLNEWEKLPEGIYHYSRVSKKLELYKY